MTKAWLSFSLLRRICSLALLLAAPAVLAAPKPIQGSWKGSIGTAPVMVCLTGVEGQYYYLRHLQGIVLARPETGADLASDEGAAVAGFVLNESAAANTPGAVDGVSGRWRFEALDGDVLTGSWTSANGERRLPIRLSRLEALRGGYACGEAFFAPVRASVRVRKSPGRFESHGFQVLASEQATAPEFGLDVPHADLLNRFTMDWLREQAVFAYECDLGRSTFSAGRESLGRSLAPVFWSRDFLVLQDGLPEVFCGGAHGNASLSHVVWSLAQGRAVDTWTWIQGGESALGFRKAAGEGDDVAPPLRRLLAARHPRKDDCGDSIPFMWIAAPYPVRDGLVFNTGFPHAVRACNDEVRLSWKQLQPYLSRQGRELMPARP